MDEFEAVKQGVEWMGDTIETGVEHVSHGVDQIENGESWQDTAAGVGEVVHGGTEVLTSGLMPWQGAVEHYTDDLVHAWTGDNEAGDGYSEGAGGGESYGGDGAETSYGGEEAEAAEGE